MLKGISPLFSPELLSALYRMGHGDEIVLADAHFPAERFNINVIRADGIKIADLLEAIMPLFELDQYSDHPLIMMAPVEGDQLDPNVEFQYRNSIQLENPLLPNILKLNRSEFYDRAAKTFVIVATGEISKYGNIILKKGVTPLLNTKTHYCE